MISFVSFFLVQNQKEVLERTNKFKILKEVIDVARKEKYYSYYSYGSKYGYGYDQNHENA